MRTEPRTATGDERGVTPGQPDMWVLVLIEAATFAAYFVVYILSFRQNPSQFIEAQAHLSRTVGMINTIVLLTSSWSMARCVEQARRGDHGRALGSVYLTLALGLTFAASKLAEWRLEIGEGFTLTSGDFFSFYYFLTGMHLLHVLVGLVVLGVAVHQLRNPLLRSQQAVETCATYWHMVDFLWVVIFPLLYLMR